jgi:hypothetical protein
MTTMAAHEAVLLFAGPECWADEARELSPGRPMNFTNVRRPGVALPVCLSSFHTRRSPGLASAHLGPRRRWPGLSHPTEESE